MTIAAAICLIFCTLIVSALVLFLTVYFSELARENRILKTYEEKVRAAAMPIYLDIGPAPKPTYAKVKPEPPKPPKKDVN